MDDIEERKLIKRLEKAKESKNLDSVEKSCRKLADFYFHHCRYEEALCMFREELDTCTEKSDTLGIANANRMIGETYNMMGQYEESLKYSNLYLDYSKAVKNKVEEQRALATIGRLYFCWASDLGKNSSAFQVNVKNCRKAYLKSLFICDNELPSVSVKEKLEMKGRLMYNLGLVAELQEESDTAEMYFTKAIQIFKTEGLFDDLCKAYDSQGALYLKQGNTSGALNLFDLSLEAAKHCSNTNEQLVYTLLLKAEAYFKMSNYMGAKNVLKKAYKVKSPNEADVKTVERQLKVAVKLCMLEEKLSKLSETEFEGRKKGFEELGDLCCQVQNYKHGIEAYLKMLDYAEKLGESGKQLLPCYESLSQTFRDDKQYDLALNYHNKELDLYKDDKIGLCKTYLSIAEVLELQKGSYFDIYEAYNKARQVAEESDNIQMQVTILEKLLKFLETSDKPEIALEVKTKLQELKFQNDITSESDYEDGDDNADINLEDMLSDSEIEEEFDRPRARVQRSCFKIKRNEKGETQLHVAVIKGDLNRAQKLIQQGHPVKEQDLTGWTPLHEACNHGHVEIVKLLLEQGANVNDPGGKGCKGVTPLHDAASCGHFEVIETLLEHGASTAVLTDSGETPLKCFQDWRKRVQLSKDETIIFKKISDKLKTSLDRSNVEKTTTPEDTPLLLEDPSPKKRVSRHKNLRRQTEEPWEAQWFAASPEKTETKPEISAQDQYISAIEAVRKRPKSKLSSFSSNRGDLTALLNEDDYVDEWLEDDLGVFKNPAKKRKTTIDLIEHDFIKSKNHDFGKNKNAKDEELKIEEIESDEEVKTKKPKPNEKVTLSFLNPEPVEVEVPKPVEPLAPAPTRVAPILKVRVKIENHVLLIPVPTTNSETLTIGWLASETCKRYHQLEGTEPVVRLTTKDGAILSKEDPLSLVYDEEIQAVVLSWKSFSLVDRYKDWCKSQPINNLGYGTYVNHLPDVQIITALEKCQGTLVLDLENMALTSNDLVPVFSALKYQSHLNYLNLQGNILSDDGIDLLQQCLEKCSIEKINLSCNGITQRGAINLCEKLTKNTQVLDLSFNPLGKHCVDKLSSFNLITLKVDYCE